MRTHSLRLFQLLLLMGFLVDPACGQKINKDGFLAEDQFQGFIPISPIDYDAEVIVIDTLGSKDTLSVKELAFFQDRILKFLPNEAVYVSITKINSEGNISYGPATASASKGIYTVTLDYAKFTTLNVYNNSSGNCDGFAKVGVGLRVTANIETKKKKLDIGSLFGLGMAAKNEKLTGTLSLDVIGLESSEITSLIPLPSEISPSSIQNVLQAIATIKSKIYDDKTRLYPQIISVKSSSGCSPSSVIKQIDEREKRYKELLLKQQAEANSHEKK